MIFSLTEICCKFSIKGDQLLKKSQFQNAKEQYFKSQEKQLHCANSYYLQAKYYININKFDEAEKLLIESIKLNPNHSNAHKQLGILFKENKNYNEARNHLEKSLEYNYSDKFVHYCLGQVMVYMLDYNDAEQHFLSAIDIDPEFVKPYIDIALLKLICNDREMAIKYYLEAKNISPNTHNKELDSIIG